MRRHENFPKCKNYFSFVCHSLFRLFTTSMRKNRKKKHLLKFPLAGVLYSWPHGGRDWAIDPSIELNPSSPTLVREKKKNRSNCLAGTQDVVEKKLNRCHLYSSTGSECAGRELTISRCLFPIDYVKNWSGWWWWWGDYYEVRHYFCTRQKHQGKHYLAKTVKDDTRVGSSPLRYRLTP